MVPTAYISISIAWHFFPVGACRLGMEKGVVTISVMLHGAW